MRPFRLILIGTLMELCYLSFSLSSQGPEEVLLFIGVNVATFLLLSLLVWRIRREGPAAGMTRGVLLVVVGFAALFRATLVPLAPVGSDDIYRYLWDGKIAASGINPYAYAPADPRLTPFAAGDLPAKVNHPDLRTVYPPLAEMFFLLSYFCFGPSIFGLKLLLAGMDCLSILLLGALLRKRGDPSTPVILYAWSPIPVLYFGLDGHIDALGIFFLLLALYLLAENRKVAGAAVLGLAALAKLFPLLVLPFLLRLKTKLGGGALAAVSVVVVAAGYGFFLEPTWGITDSLKTFGTRWEFNGGIFTLVYVLTRSNETAHLVCGIVTIGAIGGIAMLKRPLLEKVFLGFSTLFLLSPVVHPWYLAWLAALLVLRWSLAMYAFIGLSALANVTVYQYRATGQWTDQPVLLLLEYLPVLVLLAREIARREIPLAADSRRNAPP